MRPGAIMMPYGRFLASAEAVSLLDRPAVRRIWRQCRAGRAPLHHAQPAGRARRALLHAPGRSGRQHLQALCRREFPLLALRRHLPAVEPARRVPGRRARSSPRSSRPPTGSAISPSRGRSSGRSRPSCRRRAAGDRARLRPPPRAQIVAAPTATTSPMRRRPRSARLRDLPADRLRLSRDSAGRADARGRHDPQDDLALPVRRRPRARPAPVRARGRSHLARSAAAS